MSLNSEVSAKALAVWKRKFGNRHLDLSYDDPAPFELGQRLGGGGNGVVYTTKLDGIPLALKRTHTRDVNKQDMNEIQILRHLSEVRHEHVVALIGSCTRKLKRHYEIDLIMYPIAQCDLAGFLEGLDILMRWQRRPGATKEERDDADWAVETLSAFYNDYKGSFTQGSSRNIQDLISGGQQRVFRSFGCIAQAVAYMHRLKIRHKDLKPSQILFSPEGLWLTDFGGSLNTAELSQSETRNGHPMTVKYQAPERANGEPCGRAEDIFALGCTFLEMAVRLTPSGLEVSKSWTNGDRRAWSFQANLKEIERWLAPLSERGSLAPAYFAPLFKKMMAYRPEDRPSIDQVVEALSSIPCRCAPRR